MLDLRVHTHRPMGHHQHPLRRHTHQDLQNKSAPRESKSKVPEDEDAAAANSANEDAGATLKTQTNAGFVISIKDETRRA